MNADKALIVKLCFPAFFNKLPVSCFQVPSPLPHGRGSVTEPRALARSQGSAAVWKPGLLRFLGFRPTGSLCGSDTCPAFGAHPMLLFSRSRSPAALGRRCDGGAGAVTQHAPE